MYCVSLPPPSPHLNAPLSRENGCVETGAACSTAIYRLYVLPQSGIIITIVLHTPPPFLQQNMQPHYMIRKPLIAKFPLGTRGEREDLLNSRKQQHQWGIFCRCPSLPLPRGESSSLNIAAGAQFSSSAHNISRIASDVRLTYTTLQDPKYFPKER